MFGGSVRVSCFSPFVSITLMRYIAVGWRAKAQVCVASRAGSVSPGREVEEEARSCRIGSIAHARGQCGKGLRTARVNKLSSHYRRLATRYTLVKPREQMSVTMKLRRWEAASTFTQPTTSVPIHSSPGFIRMAGY